MSFSEKLRALMNGATIEDFAAQLGESAHRLRDVLREKQRPPADLLVKLQTLMGADLNWLLNDEYVSANPILSVRERDLIENYRAAGKAGQEALDAASRALVQGHQAKVVLAPAGAGLGSLQEMVDLGSAALGRRHRQASKPQAADEGGPSKTIEPADVERVRRRAAA